MSDAPDPPVATGTLAKTPFAHLVLYLYQRRSSGTLIVRTAVDEYRVLFHRGRAVAACVPQPTAALDRALMPLTAEHAGPFEFHEVDLVGSGPAVVTGMFDPFAFVAEASRRHARPEIVGELLAKYSTAQLTLDLATDLGRLGLSPDEQRATGIFTRGPATIDAFVSQGGLPPEAARRLAYTLLITRAIGPESAGPPRESRPTSASSYSFQPGRETDSTQRPSRALSSPIRPSGDAWRAIASRASEIAENRPPTGPRSQVPPPRQSIRSPSSYSSQSLPPSQSRPAEPPASRTLERARRSDSQALPPDASGPVRRPSVSQLDMQRAISRPLTEPLPGGGTPSQRAFESRPLTPGPFRGDSQPLAPAGRPPSASVPPRNSPRPSQPDIDSLDADGKFRRVEQLCQRNAFDEALPIMRILCEQDRKSAKYLGMLAHVLLGRSVATDNSIGKEIVEAVNQALRIDSDQVHALYTKARCYKRLGKEREALHYFRRTVQVDPSHLDAAREVRLLVSRLNDKRKR